MRRRPPTMQCRDCHTPLGRGWTEAPLCEECKPKALYEVCGCIPNYPGFDPKCPIHQGRNPYDIPY